MGTDPRRRPADTFPVDDPRVARDGSGCDELLVDRHSALWQRAADVLADAPNLDELLEAVRSEDSGPKLNAGQVRAISTALVVRVHGGRLAVGDVRAALTAIARACAAPPGQVELTEGERRDDDARKLLLALLLVAAARGGER
jgi:hypothetical protein